jgi:branched-chain amino acid transport system ATP-binding protein
MSALEVSDLVVGYRAEPVVREVGLTVDPGEIVSVLGPNGAGKTTLFKTIAGLVSPRSGAVRLDGEDVLRDAAESRARGGLLLVPEGRRLFGSLTVVDNLRTGAFSLREGFSIDEVLELFPRLAERRESRAHQLSGGEQQMLAIGRALCGGPTVLLLDEPSLGLAPRITEVVFQTFRRLAERGLAVVVAEQNVHAALAVADRCLVLDRGSVVFEGATRTAEEHAQVQQAYTATVDIAATAQAIQPGAVGNTD